MHGNISDGVFWLQVALGMCNQPTQNVARDRIYGDETAAAVKRTQAFWGVPRDARYGPVTGAVMNWPRFGSNGFIGCGQVFSRS